MWALLRLPLFRGAIHANDHDNRSDIAKSVFQVHGVDAAGQVVIRRQLKRRYVLSFFQKLPQCLVGIEACASSHHWSRELQALGHTVRLMPPAYVKPYVKRQKNDATDAEAICEAVTRANMRFVPTKTPSSMRLFLHAPSPPSSSSASRPFGDPNVRSVPILAEFRIVATGRCANGVEELLGVVADASDKRLPGSIARAMPLPRCSAAQLRMLKGSEIWSSTGGSTLGTDPTRRAVCRLDEIVPGVGPASGHWLWSPALLIRGRSDQARDFSAWIELVPKQHSQRRQGQARRYQQARSIATLRSLFTAGALAVISLRQNPWHQTSALAHSIAGTAADEGRRHRARQ
jgi:transposase